MPTTFPRTWPARESSFLDVPGHLYARSQGGQGHVRDPVHAGVRWWETYKPGRWDDPVFRAFLGKTQRYRQQGVLVDVVPYHGQTSLGTVASGAAGTVNGGSQTGTSLAITGLSPADGTILEDDWLAVAGVPHILRLSADLTLAGGAGSAAVWPGIVKAPANGAAVVVNGSVVARLTDAATFPQTVEGVGVLVGMRLTFEEILVS